MPEKTQQDITKEAFQQTAPEISKTKKKYRRFIDTAFFVTLLTISLFIVQYVFFKNYLNVYNVSEKAIRLDLKSFIPFAAHIGMIAIFVLMYVSQLKADKAVGNYHISLTRISLAAIVITYFLTNYHITEYVQKWISCVLIIALPFAFELIRYSLYKLKIKEKRTEKTINPKAYSTVLKNSIYDIFYYAYYFKSRVFVLVIALCLAAQLSPLLAKANNEYQIVSYESQTYAVIMDYEDDVIVEPITEKDNTLTIHTDYYKYLSKENLEITNKKYDKVKIK